MSRPAKLSQMGLHDAHGPQCAEACARYRVWPDGTVQCTEDGNAYSWMSDDFILIDARSEDEALTFALQREARSRPLEQGAHS